MVIIPKLLSKKMSLRYLKNKVKPRIAECLIQVLYQIVLEYYDYGHVARCFDICSSFHLVFINGIKI